MCAFLYNYEYYRISTAYSHTPFHQIRSIFINNTYKLLGPLDHVGLHCSVSSNHQLTPVARSKPLFSACCTSLVEQASYYSLCSLSVWCIIITQLSPSSCSGLVVEKRWHFSQCFPLLSKNIPFLKVFPSITIYPFLGLISCNLTTRCLAVTGGGSIGECAD